MSKPIGLRNFLFCCRSRSFSQKYDIRHHYFLLYLNFIWQLEATTCSLATCTCYHVVESTSCRFSSTLLLYTTTTLYRIIVHSFNQTHNPNTNTNTQHSHRCCPSIDTRHNTQHTQHNTQDFIKLYHSIPFHSKSYHTIASTTVLRNRIDLNPFESF